MAPAKKAAKTAKKAAKKTATRKATAKAATKKTTKRAAKKAAATKASAAPASQVVVASKVKDALKGGDVRMASDFVEALNGEVHDLIDRAIQRAKDNNRSTVRPQDL